MRSAFALAAALVLATAAACGGSDGDGVPTVTVTVIASGDEGGRSELTVELARTGAERGRGLMFREELAEDGGMLFVFSSDTLTSFWMKDTLVPLSIAFIGGDGVILGIQDMEPLATELHQPPSPYRYALEVNQGWFQGNGFEVGDRVEIPDSVQTPAAGE